MDKRSFNWFLTYSQCQLDPVDFNEALWSNSHASQCSGFVIARETHATGGTHYHVLLCYKKTKRVRSITSFDLHWAGNTIHGNYQVVRNLRECYNYCTKDGDYLEDISDVPGINPKHETSYWELACQAENKEKALDIIRRHNPRDYLLQRRNLDYSLDKHFEIREELAPSPYTRASFTHVPIQLDEWVWNELSADKPRRKSLIIVGPSRTGKTAWARSLGEHIYCMSALIPAACKNKPKEIDYIIFDDIEQSTLEKSQLASCWKVFMGCQLHLTLNEKYKPQETVNWGIPSIWLMNNLLKFGDLDFVHRNATIVYINDNLY